MVSSLPYILIDTCPFVNRVELLKEPGLETRAYKVIGESTVVKTTHMPSFSTLAHLPVLQGMEVRNNFPQIPVKFEFWILFEFC